MLKVANKTARLITLNVMVKGAVESLAFAPNELTSVKNKATAEAIEKNVFFKANVTAKNFSIAGKVAPAKVEEFVYTDAESFLDGTISEVTERLDSLTLEQLQEAVTLEEKNTSRKKVLPLLIKKAEELVG